MGELAPHFQPGISTPPLQFIREMVCVNKRLKRTKSANRKCGRKPLKFDAFATHPYDFEHKPTKKRSNKDEVTIANLRALPKLLDKLRKKGLIKTKRKKFPIYLTEYGYMVAEPRRSSRSADSGVEAREVARPGVEDRAGDTADQADAALRLRVAAAWLGRRATSTWA